MSREKYDTFSLEELENIVEQLKKRQEVYGRLRELAEESRRTNTKIFINVEEAALIVGCAPSFFAQKRFYKSGPCFFKTMHGKVQYDLIDLLDYMDSCRRDPKDKQGKDA